VNWGSLAPIRMNRLDIASTVPHHLLHQKARKSLSGSSFFFAIDRQDSDGAGDTYRSPTISISMRRFGCRHRTSCGVNVFPGHWTTGLAFPAPYARTR